MEFEVVTCSFCGETDFDALGLEIHLANYCMGDQSPKLNSIAYREKKNTENFILPCGHIAASSYMYLLGFCSICNTAHLAEEQK